MAKDKTWPPSSFVVVSPAEDFHVQDCGHAGCRGPGSNGTVNRLKRFDKTVVLMNLLVGRFHRVKKRNNQYRKLVCRIKVQ